MISYEWARMAAKYPERYGKLSGLFLSLLAKASETMPIESIEYYKNRFRHIDTHSVPMYDGTQLNNTDKETGTIQLGETPIMEEE